MTKKFVHIVGILGVIALAALPIVALAQSTSRGSDSLPDIGLDPATARDCDCTVQGFFNEYHTLVFAGGWSYDPGVVARVSDDPNTPVPVLEISPGVHSYGWSISTQEGPFDVLRFNVRGPNGWVARKVFYGADMFKAQSGEFCNGIGLGGAVSYRRAWTVPGDYEVSVRYRLCQGEPWIDRSVVLRVVE